MGTLSERSVVEVTPEFIDSLLEAARYDDLDDIKAIEAAGCPLDAKDEQGRAALHMATANGHLDIVDYLISKGVGSRMRHTSIIPPEAELQDCNNASVTTEDLNACNVEKNTPLHWACLNGHIEVAKRLVLAGADVSALNSHDRTPVDEALGCGKMDVIDAINTAVAQLELNQTSIS